MIARFELSQCFVKGGLLCLVDFDIPTVDRQALWLELTQSLVKIIVEVFLSFLSVIQLF